MSYPNPIHVPNALYGSSKYTSRVLSQITNTRSIWSHGWSPTWNDSVPWMGIASRIDSMHDRMFLVGNNEHETLLHKKGYRAAALGLPFAYAVQNIRGKVISNRKFDLYIPNHATIMDDVVSNDHIIETCRSITKTTSKLKILVDSHRYLHSDLPNKLSEYGFECIQGISLNDINGLERLAAIFHSVDTVFVDGFGSHIAYAAACGAIINTDYYREPHNIDTNVNQKEVDPETASLYKVMSKTSVDSAFCSLHNRSQICQRGLHEIGFNFCNVLKLRAILLSDPVSILKNIKIEITNLRHQCQFVDPKTGLSIDNNFDYIFRTTLRTFSSSFGDKDLFYDPVSSTPYWRNIKSDEYCSTCMSLNTWQPELTSGGWVVPVCERCCEFVIDKSTSNTFSRPLYIYTILRYADSMSVLNKFHCLISQVDIQMFTESRLNGETGFLIIGRVTPRW